MGEELKPRRKHDKVGSLTRRVTWLTIVYKKKTKFMLILALKKCRMQRHVDKVTLVVLEKMDHHYSSGGLSSQ
jgi:hypothetical protein